MSSTPLNNGQGLEVQEMTVIETFFSGCEIGNAEQVSAAITLGVDVNRVNMFGVTGLIIAAQNNNCAVLKRLLENSTLDVNKRKVDGENYKSGATALHEACVKDNAKAVEMLCEDIRVITDGINMQTLGFGDTPLHCAVRNGSMSCIQALSKVDNIDWNVKNLAGNTPILVALKLKNLEISMMLAKIEGISLLCADRQGKTFEKIARLGAI